MLVPTTFELDEYVFGALDAGASGFILKGGEPADVVQAIRIVAGGESLLAPSVTRRLIDTYVSRPRPEKTIEHEGMGELTIREREVLGLVATGVTNAEIAQTPQLSPLTAKTHVSRILMNSGRATGCFVATKHFAPLMIRGGGGRIIYISSIAGVQSTAGGAAYGGAKAALNILTNVAHQELANDGIRTVAIAPGLTYTPGMREIITEDHIERVAAAYPGGRLGQPEDIVALATFLCSDAASHISGTVVTVRPPVTG